MFSFCFFVIFVGSMFMFCLLIFLTIKSGIMSDNYNCNSVIDEFEDRSSAENSNAINSRF